MNWFSSLLELRPKTTSQIFPTGPSMATQPLYAQIDDDESDDETTVQPVQPGRRRSSILDAAKQAGQGFRRLSAAVLGEDLLGEDQPPPPAPKPRTPLAARKALIQRLREIREGEACSPAVQEWLREHCPAEVSALPWVAEFAEELAPELAALLQQRRAAKAADIVLVTWISCVDTLTDVLISATYFFTQPWVVTLTQTSMLIFSMVCQAVCALAAGQGWAIAALSLVGLKPVVEARMELTNAQQPAG